MSCPFQFTLQFACLNHTHFGRVAKAWRGEAPCNMPTVRLPDGKTLKLCDDTGSTSFEALAQREEG